MGSVQVPHVARPVEEYVRRMDYRVLGPLEVLVDGVALPLGGPKQRVVVAVLVAAAGHPVPVDALLEAIYGEDAAAGGRRTLQTYVSNLRQVLGDVIVRQGDAYVLTCIGSVIDSVTFEERYRAASAMTDPDDAASMLRAALATWRGRPYADVEAHGRLDGECTRLGEVRLAALEARIDADLNAGRHREVIAELEALTVEHPWRESLRAMHMLALYRSGRQTEALRAYGRTRVVLAEDLGIDPSPELKDLELGSSSRIAACSSRPAQRSCGERCSSPTSTMPRDGPIRGSGRPRSPAASWSWPPQPIAREGTSWRPGVRPATRCSARRSMPFGPPARSSTGASGWRSISATSRWAMTSRSVRRLLGRHVWSLSPTPARCCCPPRPTRR